MCIAAQLLATQNRLQNVQSIIDDLTARLGNVENENNATTIRLNIKENETDTRLKGIQNETDTRITAIESKFLHFTESEHKIQEFKGS